MAVMSGWRISTRRNLVKSLYSDGALIEDGCILLIQRKHSPFQGSWALPGGFVEYGEKTEDALIREMSEETGLKIKIRSLLGVYSDPSRDPRGHTVTVAYLVEPVGGVVNAGDDAMSAKFFKADELPELAFDHAIIVKDAFQRI
jgi:8-oxo-dGTP diphosphatase